MRPRHFLGLPTFALALAPKDAPALELRQVPIRLFQFMIHPIKIARRLLDLLALLF